MSLRGVISWAFVLVLGVVACSSPDSDPASLTEEIRADTIVSGTAMVVTPTTPPSVPPATVTSLTSTDVDPTIPATLQASTSTPTVFVTPVAPATLTPTSPLVATAITTLLSGPQYDNPEAVILSVLQELYGDKVSLNSQLIQGILSNAQGIRGMYHLAAAEQGEFNLDPAGFRSWLMEYLPHRTGETDNSEQYNLELEAHIYHQIQTAIHDPESEIGTILRTLEIEWNLVSPGDGVEVYTYFFHHPVLELCYGDCSDAGVRVMEGSWDRYRLEYETAQLSVSTSYADFPEYLAEQDYAPFEHSADRLSPTRTGDRSDSASSVDLPDLGEILYQRPLSGWLELDHEVGWTRQGIGSLHIGVYGVGEQRTMASWTEEKGFGDIHAAVRVRAVTTSADAAGCIAVRHDVNLGEYQLCVFGDATAWATYDYSDDSGNWHTEVLLERTSLSSLETVEEWSELEIFAMGNQLWFAVNKQVATVHHSARSSGAVAIHTTNFGTQTAEFEFKNLIIRATE